MLPTARLTRCHYLNDNLDMYRTLENPISAHFSVWFCAAIVLLAGCGPSVEDRSADSAGEAPIQPSAARPADGLLSSQTSSDPRVQKLESLDAVDKVRLDGAGRVKRIDFNRRLITDDTLAELRGLEHLDYLDLVEAYITDDGLAHLTDLPGLETLFLSSTTVTDEGLKHVSQIESLKTLYLIPGGHLNDLPVEKSRVGRFTCATRPRSIIGLSELFAIFSAPSWGYAFSGMSSVASLVASHMAC